MIGMAACSRIVHTPQGPRVVLADVSFTFSDSERIGILAEPGASRSMMIALLLGLERPDRGRVVRPERLSWPIGSTRAFHPALSGAENVRLVAGSMGEDPERASLYCAQFADLGEDYWRPVETYSGVMRARLGFAFSMTARASMLLADETIEVGDDAFRAKCRAALADRLDTSGLILFSRRPRATKALCDRHAVLRDSTLLVCANHDQASALFEASREDAEAEQFADYFDVA